MKIHWIALRVMQEIIRDRRTLAIFLLVPLVVMSLVYYALTEDEIARVGVVCRGGMRLFETDLVSALQEEDDIEIVPVDIPDELTDTEQIKSRILQILKNKEAEGIVFMGEQLLIDRFDGKQGTMDVYVEGSRPTMTASVLSAIASSMDDLTASMPVVINASCSAFCANSVNIKPMNLEKHYVYGSEDYRLIDFFLPVFPPFFVFFFTFIVSTITFQRERVRGTLERLMIAPVSFSQVILGYIGGFFMFCGLQAAIVLTFIISLLGFPVTISQLMAIILLTIMMMLIALVIGLFASFMASNEFQALQFIPLVILPQIFLCDLIWNIEGFPKVFQWISKFLPLTHANVAMRNVLLKSQSVWQSWPQLIILSGFFFAFLLFLLLAAKRFRTSG